VPAFFGRPFFIFMLRQFFLTIPQDISDAAYIDGASEVNILFRIILPLSKPALTVVALFAFINAWNDYLGPLIYINDAHEFVLSLGVEALRARPVDRDAIARVYKGSRALEKIITRHLWDEEEIIVPIFLLTA
jgi:ABC-type glycerol-3-phosphate transport system permease component